ncbi:phosphotransferase [Streptomyces sp. NBC_01320]|uniref:phosphotransferase n=1 Tax=Streptomyces sp. NBC_01320 TaxID=2903824 RepID=UPI002E113FD3|nr:phosphotransferase [Streptomyces sp. NBC_01320]
MKQFSLRSRVVGNPSSRAAARQMVAMCPANGRRGLALQWMAYRVVRAVPSLGLRPAGSWPLPISLESWAAIEARIRDARGPAAGAVLWHLPPADQPQVKFGALFLDPADLPHAFARVLLTQDVPRLAPRVAEGGRTGIRWPMRLGEFSHDGLSVELSTATPAGLHVPVHLGLRAVMDLCADIDDAFGVPERPADVPADWTPMHGDLAHWNLRRYRTGDIHLLDWEGSGWAPPHADLARFIMTAPNGRQLAGGLPKPLCPDLEEAALFWLDRGAKAAEGEVPAWVERKHADQAANLSDLLAAT